MDKKIWKIDEIDDEDKWTRERREKGGEGRKRNREEERRTMINPKIQR